MVPCGVVITPVRPGPPGELVTDLEAEPGSRRGVTETRHSRRRRRRVTGVSRPEVRVSVAARSISPAHATTPAVDVRSTCGVSNVGRPPAAVRASSSSAEIPPSGPTTSSTSPASGRATSASGVVASSCSSSARSAAADPSGQSGGVDRLGHGRRPQPAGLLGGLTRRAAPASQPLDASLARPAHDGSGRLPGQDLADPDLGQQLDRQLAAVPLGQRLGDDEPYVGAGSTSCSATSTVTLCLPTATTGPVTARPAAVGQHHDLPRPDPPDHGGVPALGTVEQVRVSPSWQRIGQPGVENRIGAHWPANASRSRPKKP